MTGETDIKKDEHGQWIITPVRWIFSLHIDDVFADVYEVWGKAAFA